MVSENSRINREIIVSQAEEALLLKACPDLDQWPMRWRFDDKDLAPGAALVAAFKPFLLSMLREPLAKRTFNRHRDNLWLLGGEIIKRRRDDPKLARLAAYQVIREMIEDGDGPLIGSAISASVQDEVDATCRKYYRFLIKQPSS
jgi:hypothetical protein